MANTERRCVRCGISAQEAGRQNEPICNDHGLVGGHSYRDLDPSMMRASAAAMAMDRIDTAFRDGAGRSRADIEAEGTADRKQRERRSQQLLREEEAREAAREQARLDMEAAGVPHVH